MLRSIQEDGVIVYITQHGRPAAVMLDYEQYETLLAQAQQQGWPPDYFARTYGSLADNPVARPEQDPFETRETVQ